MIFNPVIIVAIVVQSWISKVSRIAGAIVGYVITTGILLWGLAIYDQHGQIAFFGIPLAQPVFVILCIVWYVFDTAAFNAARKAAPPATPPPIRATPETAAAAGAMAALPVEDPAAPRLEGDSINFTCPECGKPVGFKRRHAGLVVRCSECNERIMVPEVI